MKTYWDSGALIDAILDIGTARFLFNSTPDKFTRCHTFAESFSTMTGGRLGFRIQANEAADKITEHARKLTVVSLNEKETLAALKAARSRGVRGAAVHDFLHAYAAEIHGCEKIVTANVSDFVQVTKLEIEAP